MRLYLASKSKGGKRGKNRKPAKERGGASSKKLKDLKKGSVGGSGQKAYVVEVWVRRDSNLSTGGGGGRG